MKIQVILSALVAILFSCKSTNNMIGKTYELYDNESHIKIHFPDKEICEIEQHFSCTAVPDSLNSKSIRAKYEVVKSKLAIEGGHRAKTLKVTFLKLENLDTMSKHLPRFTSIANYSEMCQSLVIVNSNEMKLRNKLPQGILLNLINDSLIIKKNAIIFGYKTVPLTN